MTRVATALARLAVLGSALALLAPSAAAAAGPPQIAAAWTTEVSAASATFRGEINPEGESTTYRFEYETEAAWQANPPSERFENAAKAPVSSSCPSSGCAGSGTGLVAVSQHVSALRSATAYRYRLFAVNGNGEEAAPRETNPAGLPLAFATQGVGAAFSLPDSRAWELVSPLEKNGGAIQGPEAIRGGGVIQATAAGGGITYSSTASFGEAPQGAPPASQYISTRTGAGWATENITAPTLSGDYGTGQNGVPYQLFSSDLARALMRDGRRCPEAEPCPRSYSLWEAGAFSALPGQAAGMRVLGASPDLGRILFEEEATGETYEWNGGATLVPVSLPPPSPGVLGSSADGKVVYYQSGAGLFVQREGGSPTEIAPGAQAAEASDYPAATGTSRVSADGEELLFLSTEALTGYDNHDANTGQPDSEVFLYEAAANGGAGRLSCLSCNPTNERPLGPSSTPGAYANGSEPPFTDSYKPRALSANGKRAFFTSQDALAPLDTDRAPDAYQWEAQGEGSCAVPGGCVSLISSGQGAEGASFIDASESGADAYFLTSASLSDPEGKAITPEGNVDPGSADLYDARVGGGFPEPKKPIPCESDECAPLPVPPEDPTIGTAVPGPTNPPLSFPKPAKRCPKGTRRVVKHGKVRCVRKHRKRRHR